MSSKFAAYAPLIICDLLANLRGIDHEGAAAITGNLARESGSFEYFYQVGGGSGIGWAQWTGPRNKDFMSFCETHHVLAASPQANMLYLLHDLRGKYSYVLADIARAQGVSAKTIAFEKYYEGAGVPALRERIEFAQEAFALPLADHGFITLATPAKKGV